MEIVLRVGMFVVMAMMGGPPERAFLGGGSAEKGEEKLKGAAGFVTAMGKVSVEGTRNPKLAGEEHEGAKSDRPPGKASPEDGETRQMDHDEENAGKGYTKASMHKF
jgi:hypothetical protein